MIYVQVTGGVVTNRAIFDDEIPSDWPDREQWHAHEEAQIGWAYEGGKFIAPPALAIPEPQLPDLAPYQFRAMLKLSGKQDDLYAFIEALPEPQKTVAQSKLEYSLTFKRDNDLVMAAQGALGLSTGELDALWTQAASII